MRHHHQGKHLGVPDLIRWSVHMRGPRNHVAARAGTKCFQDALWDFSGGVCILQVLEHPFLASIVKVLQEVGVHASDTVNLGSIRLQMLPKDGV